MSLGFNGDVVDFYQKYRRGYPAEAITTITGKFSLTHNDIALDLGCGTGLLTRPLAETVRAVIGMDPEPDMLARARQEGGTNITWMLGADTDIPKLTAVLGERSIGAVTIGQALHWMDHDTLLHALFPLIRPGGGVAVVTNGTPLWLHDNPWSKSLRASVEHWLGHKTTLTCGSDAEAQQRYAESLRANGFTVDTDTVEYEDELTIDEIVGGMYSALPPSKLPTPEQRPVLAGQIQRALEHDGPFIEHVRVTVLTGQVP
ncbi:trans-aconitate methyltransferase [Kibdelosporangium banguiense]|uniref:Trans-aconitate methyltransferase n=1 Tax=Kibdelosporangium banguiense TaxID=1365924 RepID=A0ABS4TU67_9PSEU|nr:class I SAM-dependent methyltransferase [Kibdelosporangium banguiense]MBP2327491.1 trans-aconitate methyltransferase [Kibdelosporangium banguiense]